MNSKLYKVLDKLSDLITGLKSSMNVTDSAQTNKFITSVSQTNGVISVTRSQPGISDINGLESSLDSKVSDVKLDNVSVVSNGVANININADTLIHSSNEVPTDPVPINADQLGGHDQSYFAKVTDLNNNAVSYKILQSNTTSEDKARARTNIGFDSAVDDRVIIKINLLDVSDSAVANQFVTAVSESNGIISVTRAQPTMSNISGSANVVYFADVD